MGRRDRALWCPEAVLGSFECLIGFRSSNVEIKLPRN